MKTFFKLAAISAAALTLVACGGGGGGGGSVQTNWAEGQADKSASKPGAAAGVTDATTLAASFGGTQAIPTSLPDVTAAHNAGWKGQGVSMITGTFNAPAAATYNFRDSVAAIAPRANVSTDIAAFTYAPLSSISAYGAIGTSTDAWNKLQNNTDSYVTGVAVIGIAVDIAAGSDSGKVFVSAGSYTKANHALKQEGGVVAFNAVDTGGGIALTHVADKTAYIAGSGAIISSKFVNLTAAEVVKNMDQSRIGGADGAFSLGRALAPKGNLR